MRIVFVPLLLFVALSSACGGSGSAASLSGNWEITLQDTATGAVKSESGFLIQSGDSLNGNFLLTGQTVCAGVGSAQGQVSANGVSISVVQVGETVNLTGSDTTGAALMSGNYSILASPCGNSQVGSWTATQVQTVTGSIKATFTSALTPGSVVSLAGMIAQGPNTGNSAATVSGSMTTTGSTCLSTATIGGQISGTAVLLNLLSSEGTAIGQYVGTVTPDATTINGTYNLFPQSPPGGCHDFGNGTIMVQTTTAG